MDGLVDARGWLPLLFCAFIGLLSARCAFEAWRRYRKKMPSVRRHAIVAVVFAILAPLIYFPLLGTLPVLAAMSISFLALETKGNRRRLLVDGAAGMGVLASMGMLAIGISPVLNFGPSMWPTAPSGWSVSIVDFSAYHRESPRRGDQVQVWVPKAFNDKGYDPETIWPAGRYHKRILALAGDRVQIKATQMLVNGERIADCSMRDEPVALGRWMCSVSLPDQHGSVVHYKVVWGDGGWMGSSLDMVVPQDHMFLTGDNLTESADSRDRGTVPLELVVGKNL
jgi:signal peptidase I